MKAPLASALALAVLATSCGPQGEAQTQGFGQHPQEELEHSDPEDCIFDPADPFEPNSRLAKGPFQGRCFDSRMARPVKVLDDSFATQFEGRSEDDLFIANFHHKGRYWLARIPLDSAVQALFQIEHFGAAVPAGHTQIRVDFAKPIELVSQSGERARASTDKIALSIEATGQTGLKYDVFKGTLDNFGIVFRLASLEERFSYSLIRMGRRIEQVKIELSKEEIKSYIRDYAAESEKRGHDHMYHTLFSNCTNELFRGFDRVLNYSFGQRALQVFTQINEIYPNIAREALGSRGLLLENGASNLPDVDQDASLAELISKMRAGE